MAALDCPAATVVGFIGSAADRETLDFAAMGLRPEAPIQVVDLTERTPADSKDLLRLASLIVVSAGGTYESKARLLGTTFPTLRLAGCPGELAKCLTGSLSHAANSLRRPARSNKLSELEMLIRRASCFGRAKAVVFLLPEEGVTRVMRADDAFEHVFGAFRRGATPPLSSLCGPLTCTDSFGRLESSLLATQPVSLRMVLYRPHRLVALPIDVVLSLTPLSGSSVDSNVFNPSHMRIGILTVVSAAALPRPNAAALSYAKEGSFDEGSVRSDIIDDASDVAGLFW